MASSEWDHVSLRDEDEEMRERERTRSNVACPHPNEIILIRFSSLVYLLSPSLHSISS